MILQKLLVETKKPSVTEKIFKGIHNPCKIICMRNCLTGVDMIILSSPFPQKNRIRKLFWYRGKKWDTENDLAIGTPQDKPAKKNKLRRTKFSSLQWHAIRLEQFKNWHFSIGYNFWTDDLILLLKTPTPPYSCLAKINICSKLV